MYFCMLTFIVQSQLFVFVMAWFHYNRTKEKDIKIHLSHIFISLLVNSLFSDIALRLI
jgi:hypothetical protein